MTGTNILTFDFKQAPGTKGPRPYVGILGMHVLLNYCIQLDFAGQRIRFLPEPPVGKPAWGKPFPLSGLGDGCVAVDQNLLGAEGPASLIDTGYRADGFLTPELFRRWTNHATPPPVGETRSPSALLGGEPYPDVLLSAELLSTGDPPRQVNGIGLRFLARHLVTFDFPNHTMYLKRTSVGPLVDKSSQAVVNEAGRFLHSLKRKGQLPGWSKKAELANTTETVQLGYPNSVTFNHVRKKGDPSIYHYEFSRPAQNRPWKLQKAWRTDQDGVTIEEYPVP
jgi:hypothetical protein